MGNKYEEHLNKGTRRMLELFSSEDISAEEREVIVSAFADELTEGIGDSEIMRDCEPLIYTASIQFIDSKISQVLSKENASYTEYKAGIDYCSRQEHLFSLFRQNGWTIPAVKNASPEKCAGLLKQRQESISIGQKILDEDKRIDELILRAENELSVDLCNQLEATIHDLEQDVILCKQKRVRIPSLKNRDTKKIRKRTTEIRKIAEQKEAVHNEILNVDLQIHSVITNPSAGPEQWKKLIPLCQKQSDLFTQCADRRWPLPAVRYEQPNKISEQYGHYVRMMNLDDAISRERPFLSTKKAYKEFFEHCHAQQENISTCEQNGWEVPCLANPEPKSVSNVVFAEKSKKDRSRRLKRRFLLAGMLMIVIVCLVLFGISKFRAGKIALPFNGSYAIGQNQNDIYQELKKAGFKNIIRKQDDSGWRESNEVLSVTIDNSEIFAKGAYKKPDVSVVITYSSEGRIYVTDLLKDWMETEYNVIEKTLKDAGFNNVTLKEVTTSDKGMDKLTAAIELDGEAFTNERCFLSKKAPIVISWYTLQIGIGNDSTEFIGRDYSDVVAELKDSGFTNVQTQVVTGGWAKGNTVVGVTVNNTETYNSSESFAPDVKIVVKFSSNDREDMTAILRTWQNTDYEELVKKIKGKGFKVVKVTEKTTVNKTQNRHVATVSINGEEYISGECYLPTSASIELEYYSLMIRIGQTAKQFEKKQLYTDIVEHLKSQGFTNIRLLRANDINWFPIHGKEGTVKQFTINGSRDFAETDSFSYDAEIIIVVHTKENEGCEDITEIDK